MILEYSHVDTQGRRTISTAYNVRQIRYTTADELIVETYTGHEATFERGQIHRAYDTHDTHDNSD